ncbi:MAG: glycosyltransferase family 39 protein [Candidatus Binatia bacterium]|jgi:4-amino-4-deoxy-L-arabinose transferase-like glycosyltransferase|nr:glycosyltransferase family 39 protein [Candidatus Binatia bacterium]
MWECTPNPPLNSYLLALVELVARGTEWIYHLACLLLAVLSAFLMYSLAGRFCGHPVTAAILSVATPAFLVSTTNVMAGIPLLLLRLLAISWTIQAADGDRPKNLWWSGLAASAAALTKCFGIALVPLLIAYWILKKNASPYTRYPFCDRSSPSRRGGDTAL